jgi:RNA polymerase sigma factor (sigma-70 family)
VDHSQRTQVRAGDHDAFGALFSDHAWRLRQTVRPEGGSLLPWLLGITLNVARNASRASRRHQAAMTRWPQARTVPDFADELAGRLDDARQLEQVHAAIKKLRRTEQDVIALCVWSGLDYAEAAEALGIPVGTVRSRLSRAAASSSDGNSSQRPNRYQVTA